MPTVKTDAFVLKSFKYKDTSKIVTLFTKEFGKINALIKGVRNFKSGKCGVLESMNYVSVILYFRDNRNLQFISSAEYKTYYPGILRDFEKIKTAFKIIDLLSKTIPENEKHSKLFELLKDSFEFLNISGNDNAITYIYFQTELMNHLGITPHFFSDDAEFETFFRDIEFTQKKHLHEFLFKLSNSDLPEIQDFEIDSVITMKVSDIYDRYILTNMHGLTNFQSRKILSELNHF